MKIIIVFCVLKLWDVTLAESKNSHQQEIDIKDILKLIQNDNKIKNLNSPGGFDSTHGLIKPNDVQIARIYTPMKSLFKSAKPHSNDEQLRYGTEKQLGIKSDKTSKKYSKSSLKSMKHDWAKIVQAVKRLHQKREQSKNPTMIVVNSKPKSQPKPKFKDLTYRLLDFLDSGVSPESSSRTKVNEIGDFKAKKIQDVLNKRGQIEFKLPHSALDQKTKKIEDALNSLSLVRKDQQTLDDKTKMIQDALNSHLLAVTPKLSLIDGSKYIQDLLKSKGYGKQNYVDDIYNSEDYNNQQNIIIDEENNANEMLDPELLEEENSFELPNGRRASYTSNSHKKRRRHRNRDSKYESFEKEYSGASASSDYEKNPGNPFTIHRNKYKQNWIWNHVMDGDHMNVNPFGPPFAHIGPSGADLFFGRKWWYYNQDDYKPLG